MIYTVTWNPSLDYMVSVRNFETGKVNRTEKEILFPGGKGINVSMVLKNLGMESTALGFLAGFTGEEIQRMLWEKGITTEFIHLKDGLSRINVKLGMQSETEINGQGPLIGEAEIQKLYEKLDCLQNGDILVLAGSIPDCMPKSIYSDILRRLENKKLKIVVDATGNLLLPVLPYHPFLIKPNHHELGEIFQTVIADKEQAVIYARKLQEMGAENVLVSMAEQGAVLVTKEGDVYQQEAPSGKVINPVGAGDSMVAGFLAGYLTSGAYKMAFEMGIYTGSASAFSEELATKQEVMDLWELKKPTFR